MRRGVWTFFLLSLLGVWPASSAWARIIQLPERAEVGSDRVSLGDLDDRLPAELGAVSLGYAPYPGHHRWVDREEVLGALRRAGFADATVRMPDRVLLTRASQKLGEAPVREAIEAHLAALFPDLTITILECEMPQEVFLPAGSIRVEVDGSNPPGNLDGVSLKLNMLVDGRHERSQWARVRAKAEGRVVVLDRDMGFDETFRRTDLLLETRQIQQLSGYFTSLETVEGAVSRRALRKGTILGPRDVKEPVLVRRGDVVTLIARGAAFQLSTSARARDAGGRGDSVVVRNLDSNQLIAGTVVGPRTVEILVPETMR
jgi:flagellar basal body P-ring formation protein FlgA